MGFEMNEEVKAELMKQAEGLTENVVDSVFALMAKYIETTENKIDDAILPFLPMAKNFVLNFVEKIDEE